MRFVHQRNSLDCGIAVAAMLAGVSYEAAAAIDPRGQGAAAYPPRGLWLNEIREMLDNLTGEPIKPGVWKIGTPRPSRPLGEWWKKRNPKRESGGLWLQHPRESWCHAIAWQGGWIFEPELSQPVRVEWYGARLWWVVKRVIYRVDGE